MISPSNLLLLCTIVATQAFSGPQMKCRVHTVLAVGSRGDYLHKVKSLTATMIQAKDLLAKIKSTADSLREMEIADPHIADNDDDCLRLAVAEAKAAVDAFGPNSSEAELAFWDADAAIEHDNFPASLHPSSRYSAAALGSHHNYNAVLDTQLLQDAIGAVDKLEALNHFVQIEHTRLMEDRDRYINAPRFH